MKTAKLPDHETQLKMLQKNPPKIEEKDDSFVTMVFSPSTKGYIAQGEHPTKEEANKDLKILKRDQGRAEMKLKKLIKEENKKTAAEAAEEFAKEAKVFPNERARQDYLRKHPNAKPDKHTVKDTAPSAKKDSKNPHKDRKKPKVDDDLSVLKGLSSEQKKKVLQKALLNMDAEKDKPSKQKDVSKEKGFEELKGLSPAAQKRVLEKALKMAASNQAAEEFRAVLRGPSLQEQARQAAEEFRLATCGGSCGCDGNCAGNCGCGAS